MAAEEMTVGAGAVSADAVGVSAGGAGAESSPVVRPLSRVERRPLYELLAERIREHAGEADLRAGAKLPAERVLAEQLGVSRASLRQAIVALEVQGLVEVRHGGGTFLRRDGLQPAPLTEVLKRQRLLPDILDAREALEVKIAMLAAERRSATDLAQIEVALEAMGVAARAGGRVEQGDADFHGAVTTAAHSSVLARMMAELGPEIAMTREESLAQPGRPAQSLAQHRAIAAAIAAGAPERAAEAMLTHLSSVRDVRLLSWTPPADEDPTPVSP